MLVGLGHPDHGADPGLQVLGGDAIDVEHLVERVDGWGDRHRREMQAGPCGQLGGVALGVLRGVGAGIGDAVDTGPRPSASHAKVATSVESMPPDSPR